METTKRGRAIALAGFVSLLVWTGSALAAPDSVIVAEAVRKLDADHDQATAAMYVLQAGGAQAAKQIRDAWPSLSSFQHDH